MHISLDSALGRQRRLNSVGESVLQIAPNATAAYSLRSLTGGDPKVVRVRRNSNNAEQDFTASGITSGALTSFVNEDVTIYQSNYSADANGWSGTTSSPTGNQDGVSDSAGTSKDNVLKLVKQADSQGYMQRNQGVVAGLTYTVSGSFLAPASNTAVDGLLIKDGTAGGISSNYPSGYLISDGTWKDFSFSYTATVSGLQRINFGISSLGANPNGSSTGSTGDIVYIANLKFVETISNGFVETWYDQSGNGRDATQATAGSQPKIVSSGALVANGLDFDGSDDKFNIPNDLIASINSASSFLVAKSDTTSSSRIALALSHSTSNFRFYVGALLSSKFNFGYQDTALKIELGAADTNKHLFTSIAGSSNAEAFLDGTSKGTVSSVDGKSTLSSGGIGSINSGNFWSGTIEEVIVYNTDQSANRVALEANIITNYGIS